MRNFLTSILGGRIDSTKEILDIKLNNQIIWSSVYNKFILRYRVKQNTNHSLNSAVNGKYYARPIFTLEDGTTSLFEENMTIYLNNGSSTTDINTLLSDIDIIEIEYNENVRKISFEDNMLVTGVLLGRTDKLTDMSSMFKGCLFLKDVHAPKWDTSNVTTMSHMFDGCRVLSRLDVSKWDTTNVTDMCGMFWRCRSLEKINVSKWDTSKVTDMSHMFHECRKLKELELSNWNTGKVTTMSHMFYECRTIEDLFISNFNLSNVRSIKKIFRGCLSLQRLDISEWEFNNIQDSEKENILADTTSLNEIRIANVTTDSLNFVISKLESRSSSSYGEIYYSLKNDYSYSDVDYITAKSKYWNLYRFCIIFKSSSNYFRLNGSKYTPSTYRENGTYIYRTDSNLTSFSFYSNSTYNSSLTEVSTLINSTVTSLNSAFKKCENLVRVNLSYLNTSNVTSMNSVFNYCSSLTSLDVSKFDTSKVNDMSYMFSVCPLLTSLDVSKFDTSKVTKFTSMFHTCELLGHLDVSKFDTSKVTNMSSMLCFCRSLTSLDVSSYKTSNVTSMYSMFNECKSLVLLDVYNFNTSNVTDMRYMFRYCSSLTSLDLSNFNTVNVKYMDNMFNDCSSLTSLDLSSFSTNGASVTDMFKNLSPDIDWHYSGYKYRDFVHSEWCTNYDGIFPWDHLKLVAQYTYSSSFTPNFNDGFEYYTRTKNNGDGTYSAKIICRNVTMPTKINFKNKTSLISIEYLNTSELGNMSYMLDGCTSLVKIDMSRNHTAWNNNWNTGTANDMSYLFNNCTALEEVVLFSFDTYEVTNMEGMFNGCSSLVTVRGIFNWDTRNVTNMSWMFYKCSKLDNIYFSNTDIEGNYHGIDTSKVEDMSYMFYECSSLDSLDLTTWNTRNITNKEYMFHGVPMSASVHVSPTDWTLTEEETEFDGKFKN